MKVIISGGGTGGHIFPAIAIANAIKEMDATADILFIGAKGRMEMEKVPAAGYPIKGLWISGLQRSLTLKNLSFPFKVISSMWNARKIIKAFKPDVVVGVGGYASGPTLRVAASRGIPTVIQEQNSYPGITNKMLAKKVAKICVAYDNMERFFPKEKIILTGNPLRQDIVNLENKKDEAAVFFGLQKDKKTVLVIGGSLGARTINESIEKNLQFFKNENVQLIWQTGKGYYAQAKNAVEALQDNGIKAFDFISKMDYAYSLADCIISRAGAISISELCVVGKPAILIPSPNVAEDHQTKNAMALVQKDAAVLVTDISARETLGTALQNLMTDEAKQKVLSKNIKQLAITDSARRIANEIFKLVK